MMDFVSWITGWQRKTHLDQLVFFARLFHSGHRVIAAVLDGRTSLGFGSLQRETHARFESSHRKELQFGMPSQLNRNTPITLRGLLLVGAISASLSVSMACRVVKQETDEGSVKKPHTRHLCMHSTLVEALRLGVALLISSLVWLAALADLLLPFLLGLALDDIGR